MRCRWLVGAVVAVLVAGCVGTEGTDGAGTDAVAAVDTPSVAGAPEPDPGDARTSPDPGDALARPDPGDARTSPDPDPSRRPPVPAPSGVPLSPRASSDAAIAGPGAEVAAGDATGAGTPADDPGGTRPAWLGTRVLPIAADGYGEVRDTPPELQDRRLPPPEHLPRPSGETFAALIRPVPADVLDRSTWRPDCPVGVDDLRYVTVTFWGFDERAHTGELLVHRTAAEDLVGVFATLFEARFPIEEMRIVSPGELDAPPTGDDNNTTAFVCRPVVGSATWSQHAYGLAVDINPFHNPYLRGDRVLPELASAYLDRDDQRPGMIQPGDVVTQAFDAIGWGWGGRWRSLDDWMHFSLTGR